jgi:hypothetical protein
MKGELYYYRYSESTNECILECTKLCREAPPRELLNDFEHGTLPTQRLFYKWGIIIASSLLDNFYLEGVVPYGAKNIKKRDLILYSNFKYKYQRFFELLKEPV